MTEWGMLKKKQHERVSVWWLCFLGEHKCFVASPCFYSMNIEKYWCILRYTVYWVLIEILPYVSWKIDIGGYAILIATRLTGV